MKFIFAFWNCALSPPGQADTWSQSDINDVADVIKYLFFEEKIEFLALCEVNKRSFHSLTEFFTELGLVAKFIPYRTLTGSEFDIGYIYNPMRIEVADGQTHSGRLGSSSIKIAQQLHIFFNDEESSLLHLLVSHWPGQLLKIAEDYRNKCSAGLRGFAERLIEQNQQVILMGDYNDEPYAHSLFKNLSATNDRALVLSCPDFWLYNPFWKSLSARVPFSIDEEQHVLGTHYSKAGNRNTWVTFDQIMFSGDFLSTGPWYLEESSTGVVLTDKIRTAIMDNKHRFDHMPVIGCIRRREAKHVPV